MSDKVENSFGQSAINEFISECEEVTHRIALLLADIEAGNQDPKTVDALYRDMHTLKGSSQLFGLTQLGELSHAIETSLDPIRTFKKKLSPELVSSLYESLNVIEILVKQVQTGKIEKLTGEFEKLIPQLIQNSLDCFGSDFMLRRDTPPLTENLTLDSSASPENLDAGETAMDKLSEKQPPLPPEENVQQANESNAPAAPQPEVVASPVAGQEASKPAEASSTIRVSVSLLDKLMMLIGEMVLVRNQVLQYSNQSDDLEFLNLSQRLDLVTSELQDEVMKTRMQPIGNILSKFQRVIRDLSQELGKKIELVLEGVDTELDKTLIEAIKDPLMHIVRNACDHGIETMQERKLAGKSDAGHVRIRAFHEGGQVIIEISDDGKGISRERILSKAIEKGLISKDKTDNLSERDIFSFLFAPGFSTAAAVTNVSGRGVGMDVVKANIEKIGGQVDVSGAEGKGMNVRLKIPLTLAIVPAMIIRSGTDRYAIPQVKLVELVRAENQNDGSHIEYLQGKPMYRLRGNLLPLVDLRKVLGGQDTENLTSDAINIVVLNSERQMFGLIVDEIQDTADIVVKPLSRFLKSLSLYSGATVLGDGSVALIIDVIGLGQLVDIVSDRNTPKEIELRAANQRPNYDAQEFLLVRTSAKGNYAMPLNLVQRLEEFKYDDIEYSGEQKVVQYRGQVLPLISLNKFLNFAVNDESEKRNVAAVVVQKAGHFYGVEVNEILDVARVDAEIDGGLRDREGILGNVIHNNEVLVVVDVLSVVAAEASRMVQNGTVKESDHNLLSFQIERKQFPILFAEDTAFFRRHITGVLEKAGFDVTAVVDGEQAFAALENDFDCRFKLVLSDIEMPKMSGLELAKNVRKAEKFSDIPMVALTTCFSERKIQEGKQAGFTSYLEKMNPEELISELDRLLAKKAEAA